jgi:hypothetical protein
MIIRNTKHVRLDEPVLLPEGDSLAWAIGAGTGALLGLPIMALYLLFFA